MSSERKLSNVTLEEYIEANGGLLSFLEGLNDFARDNGLDWKNELSRMMSDVERRARFFSRMQVRHA